MRNAANNNICKSVSSDITDWDSINWNRVERYVDKQQKRIYKAEVDNNRKKVRNIQRMLSNSKAVLLLAIRKVTETNKGRKTAGIDGYRAMTYKQKGELADELRNKKYSKI